jgi:hypothetical protein
MQALVSEVEVYPHRDAEQANERKRSERLAGEVPIHKGGVTFKIHYIERLKFNIQVIFTVFLFCKVD